MKTFLVICSIFVAVQADLVKRHGDSDDDLCFLKNSENAVSNGTIRLLQQELNKHYSKNQDADLGKLYDGVTETTLEVLRSVKKCKDVFRAEDYSKYFSEKSKSCVVEMARRKDINELTNSVDSFLADYLDHNRTIHVGNFLKFLQIYSFFFFQIKNAKCKAKTAKCFLKNAKDAKVNDTIETLQRAHTSYTETGTANLSQLYDITLEINVEVIRTVKLCNASLPDKDRLLHRMSEIGKDCMVEQAEKGNKDDLFGAIDYFTKSYSRHDQQLDLGYFQRFFQDSLGFFSKYKLKCKAEKFKRQCFLNQTKDVLRDHTIKELRDELNEYDKTGKADLNSFYNKTVEIISDVFHAVEGCGNFFPKRAHFLGFISQIGKACALEMAEKRNITDFVVPIEDFLDSYSQHNQELRYDFFKKFSQHAIRFFFHLDLSQCKSGKGSTANEGTD